MAGPHITRVCTGCKTEFAATLDNFPPHKLGKYGLHSLCIACKKATDAELRKRPDQVARQKAWRDANKNIVKTYNKAYRDAGYKSTEHVNAWRYENIDYARKEAARRARERRKSDIEFRLLCRMRARLSAMKRGIASVRTEKFLGYSMRELKEHLERQFTKGMSWEKVASGEIHIDHIVPVAAFDIQSVECSDFLACWGLANLRPLWAHENRAKSAKRDFLI